MQALVYDQDLRLTDIDSPVRKHGEALICVHLAGICNTDLEIVHGYMNFTGVPGHEFVGVVKEGDTPSLIGKRVVGEINAGCRRCDRCRAGDPRHCSNRTILGIYKRNGAFAEYLTLPETNVLTVPDSVPDTAAVFTEPLAAALQIFEEHTFHPNSTIAIIGDGKLGLLITQAARARGYMPILFGKHTEKLALAASWGIQTHMESERTDEKLPMVIECSGSPSGLGFALSITEPGGTIILKSTYADNAGIDLSQIVINEISLVGSRCGRFKPALELLEQNKIDTQSLITATYPLSNGLAAFHRAAERDSLKILLAISPKAGSRTLH